MRYNRSLDGLRGVAILFVILFHFNYFGAGWVGVQIFFVLSGFLITRILLNDRQPELGPFLRRFYIRRSLRIFPIYFAYLLGLTLLFWLSGEPAGFAQTAPSLFTYTYNLFRLTPQWVDSLTYGHFWSLAVEEQFYLVWPLVVFLLPRRALMRVCVALICVAPLIRLGLAALLLSLGREAWDVGDAVYEFTLSQLDAFAIGALLAAVDLRSIPRPGRLFGGALALLIGYGALNAALLWASGQAAPLSALGYPAFSLANMQHVISFTLIDLAAAAGLLWILRSAGDVPLLSSWPLVQLGRISYGLYIVHLPLQWVTMKVTSRLSSPLLVFLCFLAYFAVSVAVAQASYSLFERRWLALKDRLAGAPAAVTFAD